MGEKSSTPPFDTQGAVEELVAVGMPPDQAGVIVRLHLRWADRDLATGKDIDRLRADTDRLRESMELLRESMELLRENMEVKFESVEQRVDARFESVEQRIDARFFELETKIVQSSADTIKWAATSQIGTAAVYLAALLAAIKF